MVTFILQELNNYLTVTTSTAVIVDKSTDGDFLRIDFNMRYPILAVNFYAPWCYWSKRLKPSWEKAAKTMRERYDPEMDGRILLAKFDCTEEVELCRRHHIQAYPSIRIFRKGSDVSVDSGINVDP
ncbi:protein disulfide isomerase-like 5-4 [Citrus sinensis]|uniref:Protein disulfide isomerase-like 5-4 n=1 Tax=Citrus sinensis TaxID=2711 RepID=A0ACB8N444_CITSI|nr:protein disulfide isomerase-like 5-4 [Citrus sinensis]